MYSCALHTANYALTLIIMDFVCSQQPLTAHTLYELLGIGPIRQKVKSTQVFTKNSVVTSEQVLEYLFFPSSLPTASSV